MKKFTIAPGNEIRGLVIRLYPTAEQEELLLLLSENCRRLWNELVSNQKNVRDASRAYAVKAGLVPPPPPKPNYDGLDPEVARTLKKESEQNWSDWLAKVSAATADLPECAYRDAKEWLAHFGVKHDYQMLWRWLGPKEDEPIYPGAALLQALCQSFWQKSDHSKRPRGKNYVMPLRVRSGKCYEYGEFGKRGKNPKFYDCQIKFNGLKIRGRLPSKTPEGRVLEGVSITRKADGWWASVKQEVPIRKAPDGVPGTVLGIDVGLIDLVAFSEPVPIRGTMKSTVPNPRTAEHTERIAGLQAMASKAEPARAKVLRRRAARLHLRAARQVQHLVYNDIVKNAVKFETVRVEKLSGRIGQMGSASVSAMRMVTRLLKERLGNRLEEVDAKYTSQDCSQCGHRSKESWSYENGRYGECPACGYREHRDINAARNIAARSPKSSTT